VTRFVDNYYRRFKAETEKAEVENGEEYWEVAILTEDYNAFKDLIRVPLSIGDSGAAERHAIERFKKKQKKLRKEGQ
jgi:hypothetical protein